MSYDLFFKPRTGTLSLDVLLDRLGARPRYRVDPPQAIYENEETGVYFVIDLTSSEADASERGYPVALTINVYRPSTFIREIAPEVTALVSAFDWTVLDPQVDGMGEGEYREDRLIAGWTATNAFAYAAILRDPAKRGRVLSLPSGRLAAIWSWNDQRRRLQHQVGDETFVPRILFVEVDGAAASAAVWPDAIPSVLPEVDYLLVARDTLAPRRLFRRQPDHLHLAWHDARPLIERHGQRLASGAFSLCYDGPPADLITFIRGLPADPRPLVTLPADQVLDRELAERAMQGR